MNSRKISANSLEVNAILERYGVLEASVFGSFARESDVTPESDIDLLVTYKQGTTLFDVASLQDELEQVLGRKVDLISQKHISARLARRIKNDIRPLSSML